MKKAVQNNKIIYKIIKRTFDILLSLFGLIFLIPIALIIKVSYVLSGDNNSIIFKQDRTGLNGNVFKLYKFRSMKIDNDIHDKSKEDEFTKVGSIIRKFSIDELPQIINVDCCWC